MFLLLLVKKMDVVRDGDSDHVCSRLVLGIGICSTASDVQDKAPDAPDSVRVVLGGPFQR